MMNIHLEEMHAAAGEACALLKALANEDRLLILCNLATGEKNVSELQALLSRRQPVLSQQLARLRLDRLVESRRAGKEIYYRIASEEAARVLQLLYEMFCPDRDARHDDGTGGASSARRGSGAGEEESAPAALAALRRGAA